MTEILENTPEVVLLSLMLLGICAFILACGVAFTVTCESIHMWIHRAKVKYAIKHRFDKPPKAKCYCVDCKRHGEDGRCYKFERWITADNWFCWDADPKER